MITTLKKKKDFDRVSNDGKYVICKNFIIQFCERKDEFLYYNLDFIYLSKYSSRYGIIASKKIGNAVSRNLAKRKIRSLVRETFPRFSQSEFDYVIIAKKGILKTKFTTLKDEFTKNIELINKKLTKLKS